LNQSQNLRAEGFSRKIGIEVEREVEILLLSALKVREVRVEKESWRRNQELRQIEVKDLEIYTLDQGKLG